MMRLKSDELSRRRVPKRQWAAPGSGFIGSDPVGSGPVGSGPVRSVPVGSGLVAPGLMGSGLVGSGLAGSGLVKALAMCTGILISSGHLWAAGDPNFFVQGGGLEEFTVLPEPQRLAQAPVASDTSQSFSGSELQADPNQGSASTDATDSVPPASSTDPAKHDAEADSLEKKSWIDGSHGYVTQRTNDLTQWFDNYFGDTESDQEVASSRLRLRFINDWDQREGNAVRVRLGGKVNLPQISKRLDLVFQGDDPGDQINGEDDPSQSRVGLQYQVGNERSVNHRFDLTVGVSSSGPRPGVKYRYKEELSDRNSLRFTQRIQYELDDGAYSTSRLELEHRVSDRQMFRSYTRMLWGENTDGQELSTALQWVRFFGGRRVDSREVTPQAFIMYGELWAVTEPYEYISNYRLGARFRRQTFRDYLFLEFEPSYNWRIDEPYLRRKGAWRVELRAEFLLFNDLRRDDD